MKDPIEHVVYFVIKYRRLIYPKVSFGMNLIIYKRIEKNYLKREEVGNDNQHNT